MGAAISGTHSRHKRVNDSEASMCHYADTTENRTYSYQAEKGYGNRAGNLNQSA